MSSNNYLTNLIKKINVCFDQKLYRIFKFFDIYVDVQSHLETKKVNGEEKVDEKEISEELQANEKQPIVQNERGITHVEPTQEQMGANREEGNRWVPIEKTVMVRLMFT